MNNGQKTWLWPKERIFMLRDTLNRTQREMAKMMGVSQRTIFRWEKGEDLPRRKMIRKMEKLETKLIRGKLRESERPAAFNEEKDGGDAPTEDQNSRQTLLRKRLRAREEADIALRKTHKALETSWKVLHRTGRIQPK